MIATVKPPNPYRLFDFYRYEDRAFFYGRKVEAEQIVGEVLSTRLLVLFAPSGSGKTSLLNAGVRPLLEAHGYRVLTARVMPRLADSLLPAVREARIRVNVSKGASLIETLKVVCPAKGADRKPIGSDEEGEASTSLPMVMILDQFEEFFIRVEDRALRRRFIEELADLVFSTEIRIHFILSIRSDYFVGLNEFREAIPSIFHNNANVELRPLTAAAAKEAIEEPARQLGIAYAPGLVEQILSDLQQLRRSERGAGDDDEPRILPIHLQTVCHRLWELLPESRVINAESYQQAGTATEIVTQRVFGPLSRIASARKPVLLRLLATLITFDETRRQLSLEQLTSEVRPKSDQVLRELIDSLKEDLLISESPDRWIEFRHDFLAARIAPWVAEEKQKLAEKKRRTRLLSLLGTGLVAVFLAWIWVDYHTYTAELGGNDRKDELVIARGLQWVAPFKVFTGFSRKSLLDGGVSDYRFNVPQALTDWNEVAKHLTPIAKGALELATKLDFVGKVEPEEYKKRISDLDPKALDHPLISYYVQVDDRVLAYALAVLQGGDPASRRSAAYALGGLGSNLSIERQPSVVGALVAALPDPQVKGAATDALGELGAKLASERQTSIIDALLTVLRDQDTEVKSVAADALARIGPNLSPERQPSVIEALSALLRYPNPDVKIVAINALGGLGADLPPERLSPVLDALLEARRFPDSAVQSFAINALGLLGANLPTGRQTSVLDALLEAVRNPNSEVKSSATAALGRFGANLPAGRQTSVLDALLEAVRDPDSEVKSSATAALGGLGPNLSRERQHSVIDALLAGLKGTDYSLKGDAEDALTQLGANIPAERLSSFLDALLAALRDTDPDVKRSVALVLGTLGARLSPQGHSSVVEGLLATRRDTDSTFIASVAEALTNLGANLPAGPRSALIAAVAPDLRNADPLVRIRAALVLGGLGPNLPDAQQSSVVDVLVTALRDNDSTVKASAIEALGEIGAKLSPALQSSIVEALLLTLRDSDSDFKSHAMTPLRNLRAHLSAAHQSQVVEAMLADLRGPDSGVESKVEALTDIAMGASPQQLRDSIIALADLARTDEDGDVAAACQTSLRKLTRSDSLPNKDSLLKNLEDPNSHLRTLAIVVLPRRQLAEEDLSRIRELRKDPRPWVRTAALDTLVEIARERDATAQDQKKAEAPANQEQPREKVRPVAVRAR